VSSVSTEANSTSPQGGREGVDGYSDHPGLATRHHDAEERADRDSGVGLRRLVEFLRDGSEVAEMAKSREKVREVRVRRVDRCEFRQRDRSEAPPASTC
jgi:hypothetical protein